MAHQYSDLFTYQSFEVCGNTVSYVNATLLKELGGKKVGAEIAEIQLNVSTGKITVPRRRSARTDEIAAAKTLVEFKGVHTRFPDTEPVDDEKDESSSRTHPNNISGMIGLRIYENKRKLLRLASVEHLFARKIYEHFCKEMRAVKSDISAGPRGDITFTFQTSSMECIPERGMFHEFIVLGCRYYYKRM